MAAAPSAPVVSFDAVTRRFGGRVVIGDATVAFDAGTLTRVHGRNGSGKSTLLRLAAGVLRPSSGAITRASASVGYVPERGDLGGGLPAGEYLRRMARIGGQDDARADALLARYGLEPFARLPIRTLSKGTERKVVLVQALLDPGGLLVLDEPSDGLDAAAVEVLRADVAAAVERGAAVLLAAHTDDLDDLRVPTRALTVDAGTVHLAGPSPTAPVVRVELVRDGALRALAVPADELSAVLLRALPAGETVHRVEPVAGVDGGTAR